MRKDAVGARDRAPLQGMEDALHTGGSCEGRASLGIPLV